MDELCLLIVSIILGIRYTINHSGSNKDPDLTWKESISCLSTRGKWLSGVRYCYRIGRFSVQTLLSAHLGLGTQALW